MFEYKAVCINVVDGDTCDVLVDLGFRITLEQRVRLYGIDTPERGAPGAAEATDALRLLVIGFETIPLTIATVKPHDKYGRWLAKVATPQCADVAAAMIERGLGTAYFGGAKG